MVNIIYNIDMLEIVGFRKKNYGLRTLIWMKVGGENSVVGGLAFGRMKVNKFTSQGLFIGASILH